MTHDPRPPGRIRYQVKVAGLLSPMLRSTFADLGAIRTATVTVLRLRLSPGQGPADIAAMLERKGLVLVGAQPVRAPLAGPVDA
ncbi:hypothetical protein [Pengzhenrongella frigida]|uniref:Uncharacterized protein n=1 Tax=Pengzhenrongella frigida TaxID=1259133 RepID=A0A4Q5N3I1_9MICO|nr:hypothetical protein [Cellulomonas sp. HLT2-17]RYV52716.1 hypothetical protein EUA98_01885 [Cellulomonas sp. HLT2-17]